MLRLVIFLVASNLPALASNPNFFFGPPSHVVEFTPTQYIATLTNDTRVWIVLFYADWCGHCQAYAPTFKAIAEHLQVEADRVQFGAVDCAFWYDFCSTANVHSYPTLRSFHIPPDNNWSTKGSDIPRPKHAQTALIHWIQPKLPAHTSKKATELTTHKPQNPRQKLNKLLSDQTKLTKQSSSNISDSSGSRNGNAAESEASSISMSPLALTESALDAPLAQPSPQAAAMHLLDAEVALLYSLRHGAFLEAKETESSGSTLVLQGATLVELRNWLTLLAALLPSMDARRDILVLQEIVSLAQASTAGLDYKVWMATLDKQGLDKVPPQAGLEPKPFLRLCKSYTCGLWTLFHILILAATEQQPRGKMQGLLSKRSVSPQPQEVLVGIRNFVANFFGCAECVTNFLHTFDSCEHNRCNLDNWDGVGMSLWLWEVHNGVSQRVAREREVQEGGKPWPSKEDCGTCWLGSSNMPWDRQAVYNYLQATYWRPEWTLLSHEKTPVYNPATLDSYQLLGIISLAALSYLAWRTMRRCCVLGFMQREKGS